MEAKKMEVAEVKKEENRSLSREDLLELQLASVRCQVLEERQQRLAITKDLFSLRIETINVNLKDVGNETRAMHQARMEVLGKLAEKYEIDWKKTAYDDVTGELHIEG